MAKKSKDPNKSPSSRIEQPSRAPNDSSTIFNKLFGEIPESEPSNSLFSSDNPFRRNPSDSSRNPQNLENIEDGKTTKRAKDKNPSEGGQKLKKEKLGNPNLDGINGFESKNEKKKKKRKRDELEREYEVKKYGVAPEVDREKEVVGKKRKAVDDVEEMVVSQEGYDDESKLLRTVFVGNLPLKTKKKALMKEFSKFGEIESVRIRSVPTLDSKKPKKVQILNGKINEAADSVNAYIVFKTEQAAELSLAHNMSMVGGNHIRVDRACPPRKKLKGDDASVPLYSSKRTVFVGNLPFDVKDEELYQLFCGIKQLESSIEAVRVIRDRHTSLGKGIAYVLFKTREAANFVCKKHNLKLRDRELRICHAKSSAQSTPSKRKNAFPEDLESSPVKKFSAATKSPGSRYKVNTKGDTSYQGLRASKSSEKRKNPLRTATPVAFKPGKKSGEKIKERKEKRPAVAARKAKANALKAGGVSNQAGMKRKMDVRTPQSSNLRKKAKKSK